MAVRVWSATLYDELGRPLEYLVECWAKGWSFDPIEKEEYEWACMEPVDDAHDNPEKAWAFILLAISSPICEPHLGLLAAGPLEDLLFFHGTEFIDRVEVEAKSSPQFAHVLGGVWRFRMTDDVWTRVQKVWNPSYWHQKIDNL